MLAGIDSSVCDCQCRACKAYNVGGDEVLSLAEVARIVCAAKGSTAGYVVREYPADRKKIDIGDYYSDYGLFERGTGWRPRVPFAEGVARTVAYFADSLERYL